jgi:hypothetical protein
VTRAFECGLRMMAFALALTILQVWAEANAPPDAGRRGGGIGEPDAGILETMAVITGSPTPALLRAIRPSAVVLYWAAKTER